MNLFKRIIERINRTLDFVLTDTVINILFCITLLFIPVLLFYDHYYYLILLWPILEFLDYRKSKRKTKNEGEDWKW
jgi:hypothetical protein